MRARRDRRRGTGTRSPSSTAFDGERYIEPEIHRLRGRLLVVQSPGAAPEAIRSIHRALEIARKQEARGWQLRAAIELCTLPVAHPEVAAAHLTLAEILESFTEGFDTRDLRTARELITSRNLAAQ